MATHRSLNKLEFKAHMSIHNKVEVPEGESHDANYTRDRFGKNHLLSDADGSPRVRRGKKPLLALVLVPTASIFLAHGPAFACGTDVKIESEDVVGTLMNEKTSPPKDDYSIYKDGDSSIGFNEDGDPNMKLSF